MELVDMTEYLVKSVAKNKDAVKVKLFDDTTDTMIIQVLVDESDMGSVIGHGGMIAKAIRTLVQAASYNHENKLVRISIDSF